MYLKIVKFMKWLYPYVQVIGVWWWVCGSFKVTPEVFSCFLQTSQVLPHWLNHHFSLILVLACGEECDAGCLSSSPADLQSPSRWPASRRWPHVILPLSEAQHTTEHPSRVQTHTHVQIHLCSFSHRPEEHNHAQQLTHNQCIKIYIRSALNRHASNCLE